MRMNVWKGLAAALMLAAANVGSADTITQWTFEGDVITPSTGTGTASLIGGTSATFAAGNGGGRAWNTSTYPAQSTNSGTAGTQYLVDTTGYEDIIVSYDHRSSGTNSRWSLFEYTLNGGGSWTAVGNNGGSLSPHDSFYAQGPYDFSAISGADNNPNFGFRIVSIFSPDAFDQNATLDDFGPNVAYQRANDDSGPPGTGTGTGDYGTSGTWRFDNVTVSGTLVPEPSACLLGSLALAGLVGLARRRVGHR